MLTALGELDARWGSRTHPLLGRGSVHASLIEGGAELSSYPARCIVGLERRTLPGETAAEVEAELAALLDRCRASDPELAAEQRTLLVREPFEVTADAEIVGAVRQAAASVLGPRSPGIGGASYWADSAFIAAAGIPTVLFGPGGEGAHALEEWVSISDTELVARTLVATAERVCAVRARSTPSSSRRPCAEREQRCEFHAALPGYRADAGPRSARAGGGARLRRVL